MVVAAGAFFTGPSAAAVRTRHGGRTTAGVYARIAQRLLAMAATIWHNWATSEPVKRSLIAYDH